MKLVFGYVKVCYAIFAPGKICFAIQNRATKDYDYADSFEKDG